MLGWVQQIDLCMHVEMRYCTDIDQATNPPDSLSSPFLPFPSGLQCFWNSVKTDGSLSLYRGMLAPVVSQTPINAVLFAAEEVSMRVLEPNVPKEQQKFSSQMLAGAFAGFMECFIIVPADKIKCLVQADGIHSAGAGTSCKARRKYAGTIDCASQVFKAEGVLGFYKGYMVTATREIPSFGVYFSTYKNVNIYLQSLDTQYMTPFVSQFFAGGCAGAMSWISIYPFDVIKTTIQTAPVGSPLSGGGTFAVGRMLHQKHGWRIFTKGLGTTIARAFPVNGITFSCYEKLKKVMEL